MSRSPKSRSGQLLEPLPTSPEVASRPAAEFLPAQSITALWLADPPTWALERLHPPAGSGQHLETPSPPPVVAVSGERVIGSNHPARKAGIRPDETLSRALQLCPGVAVHPHDAAAMMAAWDAAILTAYSFSPWVEPVNVGLMFVGQLSPREARDLARAVGARAGQAPSRSTAQIAALIAREGEVRAVPNETAFIAQVPVGYLAGLGFSEEMIERLHLFGVEHLADLHRLQLTRRQLEAQFRSEGRRLYQVAHGELNQPVQRFKEPPVARQRWEFEEPALEPHQFLPVLHLLTANAATELNHKVCWTVTVSVQYKTTRRLHRRVLGAATNSPRQLLHVAELTFWDAHVGGEEVEALEVALGRIALPEARRQDLFGVFERPPVWDAVERVDARFSGGIGQVRFKPYSRFREEGWFFAPLGPSQQAQVGDGRRLR